jgi:hypothetical protein
VQCENAYAPIVRTRPAPLRKLTVFRPRAR